MKKAMLIVLMLSTMFLTGCVNESKMESMQKSAITKSLLEEEVDIEKADIKNVDKDIYKVSIENQDDKYYYFNYPMGRLSVYSTYDLKKYSYQK